MGKKLDHLIDIMFQCLPATSGKQICQRLTKKLGEEISLGTVWGALAHLRRNVADYGWTVPHVKRGIAVYGDENRFFAVLVEKDADGGSKFTFDEQHRNHLDNGSRGTMSAVKTQCFNLATMLDVSIQYERSTMRKHLLEDMSESITFVAKRAARVVAQIDAEKKRRDGS